jgi:cysteine synthase A
LPEGMSQERFDWLKSIAGEVIATPGCESNVKEIFDKCWELRGSGQDLRIFNQFDEMGNPMWHYHVTGSAVEEVIGQYLKPKASALPATSLPRAPAAPWVRVTI